MIKGEWEWKRHNFEAFTSGNSILVYGLGGISKQTNSDKKLFKLTKLRKSNVWPLTPNSYA